jgi:hypothetical protein
MGMASHSFHCVIKEMTGEDKFEEEKKDEFNLRNNK